MVRKSMQTALGSTTPLNMSQPLTIKTMGVQTGVPTATKKGAT
jgi:hypothetical protein